MYYGHLVLSEICLKARAAFHRLLLWGFTVLSRRSVICRLVHECSGEWKSGGTQRVLNGWVREMEKQNVPSVNRQTRLCVGAL